MEEKVAHNSQETPAASRRSNTCFHPQFWQKRQFHDRRRRLQAKFRGHFGTRCYECLFNRVGDYRIPSRRTGPGDPGLRPLHVSAGSDLIVRRDGSAQPHCQQGSSATVSDFAKFHSGRGLAPELRSRRGLGRILLGYLAALKIRAWGLRVHPRSDRPGSGACEPRSQSHLRRGSRRAEGASCNSRP